jgi:hypothetical protein
MTKRRFVAAVFATAVTALAFAAGPAVAGSGGLGPQRPTVGTAAAFDVSPALRDMPMLVAGSTQQTWKGSVPRDRSLVGRVASAAHQRDGAVQTEMGPSAMSSPLFTFEGPRNENNFDIFGIRVNPPDPNGDVGQQHYIATVNLTFAIYTKTGTPLYGPADIGSLWQGFSVPDCARHAGDEVVVYDEISNRWILTQFTTVGPQYWNCVAVSTTQDPLGSYYRYAFSTGPYFPDYPKYGIMGDGLYITTREFGPTDEYQIGVYAINRHQLVEGDPNPTVVSFYLVDGVDPLYLLGDGILPADQDGKRMPPPGGPEYFAGTMDDDYVYGAPYDAINWFEADVDFAHPASSTFALTASLPTAPFDSNFPCAPDARDCLPQPGIVDPAQYLDILSYRQRPTFRLQYRNFKTHESLVTNQSVEAAPGVAGVRWYEIRNPQDPVIYQQGTYAPGDGVHRWMGSVAQDKYGNIAAGYSVVNGIDVKPGIRYAGRLSSDPLGQLSQGEAVIKNGTGVQTTTNSRWGDYTSMSVDPRDDCTFYYMNEYYERNGTPADTRPWQTRIGAFKFPGC